MVYDPKEFNLEKTSIWSFKERGTWATHKGDYRGNCPPQVPRNLILKYTKENDIVLDPFCGSGTTMVECKLLNRKGIGIDVNENALNPPSMGFSRQAYWSGVPFPSPSSFKFIKVSIKIQVFSSLSISIW